MVINLLLAPGEVRDSQLVPNTLAISPTTPLPGAGELSQEV